MRIINGLGERRDPPRLDDARSPNANNISGGHASEFFTLASRALTTFRQASSLKLTRHRSPVVDLSRLCVCVHACVCVCVCVSVNVTTNRNYPDDKELFPVPFPLAPFAD